MLEIFLAAVAIATPTDPLPPNGKWTVDWGETHCAAHQKYGDPAKPTTFVFKPSIDGGVIHMMLSRKGSYQNAAHFNVTVGDLKTTALTFTPKGSGLEVYWINIARADFDRLAKEPALQIEGRKLALELSTLGFAAAAAAMDTCNRDLRSHWNVDEAGQARIGTKAVALLTPDRYVTARDYPRQASIEGRDGSTAVSLLIDEAGSVKDCLVEKASGVATLDAQSCLIIKARAKFRPARDAEGKPIRSRITYRFSWKSR
ncbi:MULTISPECIES: energy transducer TonB [unclassified Sphingomonas]|uniref:energy transducer TonB n=1 Tax=unclassified Sphingomonas TaxID=196159 RepID=UPI0021507169|nr:MULTISPECIES: energy transducer TonB [unclassified Sphingomonas]MCR5871653.1 energy transducer TonB [Sphingomonas sp. J344]UUY00057.1 energy transducer TonB [Sphingomonas sp. J315]